MNAIEYIIAFGAVAFAVLIPVAAVRAHRLKEDTLYAGCLVFGLMSLACISAFFLQFALLAVFLIAAVITSVLVYPEMREINFREADRQRQETNVTEPVKARDLLNMKAWYKLAFRWGVRKTMVLYILVCCSITAPALLVLHVMGVIRIPVYYIGPVIAEAIFIVQFYQQLKKNQLTPQGSTKQAPPLPEPPA